MWRAGLPIAICALKLTAFAVEAIPKMRCIRTCPRPGLILSFERGNLAGIQRASLAEMNQTKRTPKRSLTRKPNLGKHARLVFREGAENGTRGECAPRL